MPKRKYKWWASVRQMLYNYPKTHDPDITFALWELAQNPNGVETNILLRLVYFKRTNTLHGAATLLGLSGRTAERRIADGFFAVAKKKGYLANKTEDNAV